jgi:hypothetical protein
MRVFIGVDPHKLSATIEVVDDRETVLATGRFGTDKAGYAAMRKHVRAWPERVWAVEGSNGAGRPLAQRLLADGEHVVDVPAKLSARARALDTGHNRKTDAHDAHAVGVVAVRTTGLRVLAYDEQLEARLVSRRLYADLCGIAEPSRRLLPERDTDSMLDLNRLLRQRGRAELVPQYVPRRARLNGLDEVIRVVSKQVPQASQRPPAPDKSSLGRSRGLTVCPRRAAEDSAPAEVFTHVPCSAADAGGPPRGTDPGPAEEANGLRLPRPQPICPAAARPAVRPEKRHPPRKVPSSAL